MAVPTITSVTPSTGPTGGHVVVEIVGTNFRMPVIPAGDTRIDPPEPSISVTFGGRAALRIELFSTTRVVCLIPKGDAGAQTLTIRNLDDDGDPIVGETVSGVFTYFLPKLIGESHVIHVIRQLITELKRQVTPNVQWLTDVDHTPDASIPEQAVAKSPNVTIVGPTTNENRLYSDNGPQAYANGVGGFVVTQASRAYDLEFTIVLESDNIFEILNLREHVYRFYLANPFLEVDCNSGDVSAGIVRYELDLKWFGNRFTGVSSEDNLRRFAGSIVIRGVKTEGLVLNDRDLALGADVPTALDVGLDGQTTLIS